MVYFYFVLLRREINLSQIKRLKIMNLEEVKRVSASCIYRITFPDGKIYVGQTVDLRRRVHLYERNLSDDSDGSPVMLALRKFGIGNVEWDVLCAISVRDKEDLRLCLSILEIKYIRDLKSLSPRGYNVSVGGELLGIPADVIESTFGASAPCSGKSVLLYAADGDFIEEHSSVGRCAYALGVKDSVVVSAMKSRGLVCGNYMVCEKKYGKIPERIPPFTPEIVKKKVIETEVERVYEKCVLRSAAILYDVYGQYVGLFDTDNRARKYIGVDYRIPYGREFHGYYIFHYNGGEIKKSLGLFTSKMLTTCMYDDVLALGDAENIGDLISLKVCVNEEEDEDGSVHSRVGKKGKVKKSERNVVQYTLDGDYIASYTNLTEAAQSLGILETCIRSCCDRRTMTSGGFIFRYADDEEPVLMSGKYDRCHNRRINQYSLEGDYIRTFNSVVDAAREMEVFASGIRACCKGKVNRCGDYRYVFADEDEKSPV